MPLEIVPFVLGPIDNNTYLIADPSTGAAVVIDPSFDSQEVLAEAHKRGWRITQVWLTHAHFDHIAGVNEVASAFTPALPVGLHPADLPLWEAGGDGRKYGLRIETNPAPSLLFEHGQHLDLGHTRLEVRHAPGHTPGHVMFYSAEAGVLFCGDVIFQGSVGRTDLPGGDTQTLLDSIRTQVLSLPGETRLLSGHGLETTVAEESRSNPFL